MCFPSSAFVAHVLRSAWLTFHLPQVPLLLAACRPHLAALPCQKKRTTKKKTKALPSHLELQNVQSRHFLSIWNPFSLSQGQTCSVRAGWCRPWYFSTLCLWPTVYWSSSGAADCLNKEPTKTIPPPILPSVRRLSSDEAPWKHCDRGRESKFGCFCGLPIPESYDEDFLWTTPWEESGAV